MFKPQPYDKLLRKALGLLTETSMYYPEKTGDMNDLVRIRHLQDQAQILMESYDLMTGAT